MDTLDKFIAGIFSGLDIRRRWVMAFGFVLFVVAFAFLFEFITGYFYYQSLGKKVELIKEMQLISKDGIASNSELYPLYKQTITEINQRQISPVSFGGSIDKIALWKGITGASIWALYFLLAVTGLVQSDGDAYYMMLGTMIFGVICGLLGAVIPTIYNPWVNYIGFPIIQFIILAIIGLQMEKSKKKKSAVPNN